MGPSRRLGGSSSLLRKPLHAGAEDDNTGLLGCDAAAAGAASDVIQSRKDPLSSPPLSSESSPNPKLAPSPHALAASVHLRLPIPPPLEPLPTMTGAYPASISSVSPLPKLLPLHRRLHLVRGDALQVLARGPSLDALRRSRIVFCNNFDAKWTEDGFQNSIFRLLSRNMSKGAILVSCSRFTRGVRRFVSHVFLLHADLFSVHLIVTVAFGSYHPRVFSCM